MGTSYISSFDEVNENVQYPFGGCDGDLCQRLTSVRARKPHTTSLCNGGYGMPRGVARVAGPLPTQPWSRNHRTMQIRVLPLLTVAGALFAATSCVLPSPPLQPSGGPELQIRGTTLLMMGGRGRLTAWLPDDGRMREVRADWTTEGDAISITRDGVVAARHLGNALVRASYQDLTGTGTVHVVTTVAGTWRGSITVVDCWQSPMTSPNPCQGRQGLTAPLALEVTQSATADQYDNLRATVHVFTPPATGRFIGAVDSSGFFFLDGHVERAVDSLSGEVKLRWQLENDRLVPFTADGRTEDLVDVGLSIRMGSSLPFFNEIWRLSTMTR